LPDLKIKEKGFAAVGAEALDILQGAAGGEEEKGAVRDAEEVCAGAAVVGLLWGWREWREVRSADLSVPWRQGWSRRRTLRVRA